MKREYDRVVNENCIFSYYLIQDKDVSSILGLYFISPLFELLFFKRDCDFYCCNYATVGRWDKQRDSHLKCNSNMQQVLGDRAATQLKLLMD